MIRTLALLVRRPDLGRDAFRLHYEQVHVPLARPQLPGLRHYVRNHVAASLDGVDPPFDVLTEFGYGDVSALEEAGAMLASERGDSIRRDELTFMDKPRNTFFGITERALAAGGSGPRPADAVKVALLASRPGAMPRESFFEEHAKALAPLLDEAAAFSHWETRRIHDAPACDAATFLWYAPERYDEGRLSAWQSPGERVWRLRVSEHVTHFEQV